MFISLNIFLVTKIWYFHGFFVKSVRISMYHFLWLLSDCKYMARCGDYLPLCCEMVTKLLPEFLEARYGLGYQRGKPG